MNNLIKANFGQEFLNVLEYEYIKNKISNMEIGGNYIKGFDTDNHLTNEVKKGLENDGYISQKEADFMVKIIDKYGRKNIKINKIQLRRLAKNFGLNYSTKLEKIGPALERRLRKRANIKNKTTNNLSKLKNSIDRFSKSEIMNLATIVKAEAGGEGRSGKIAVAYVILNRMKFGHKSLEEVLFKRTKSGKSEFSPIDDGRFEKMKGKSTKNDIKLIKDILSGKIKNPIGNATFFERSDLVNSWHKRATNSGKLKIIKTIGNHTFYAENKSHTYTKNYSKKNNI